MAWKKFVSGFRRIQSGSLAVAVCLAAGCTEPELSGKDIPPPEEKTPAERLIGVWKFVSSDPSETDLYTFGSDGRYQSFWVWGTDTNTHEGTYRVIDSMVHMILLKDGRPLEEIWLRFTFTDDSMTLCKGVSLQGEAPTLVGEWKITASVPDSAGHYGVFSYSFTADGLMLIAYPGSIDTAAYAADGLSMTVHDPVTGKVEMNMGYEIVEGRLSLYNKDSEKRLYRVE